jgi:hypothetical protein
MGGRPGKRQTHRRLMLGHAAPCQCHNALLDWPGASAGHDALAGAAVQAVPGEAGLGKGGSGEAP